MAVVLDNNFVDVAGTSFVSSGAYSNVAGTPPLYADTANPGVSALQFPAAQQSIVGATITGSPTVRTFSRIWKITGGAPTATQCEVLQVRVGAARGVGLAIRSTGLVRILNNDGSTSMGTTTSTVPIGTEFRVTWTINGTAVTFAFYPDTTSTTPTQTIGPFTSSGQGAMTQERDGFITNTGLGAGIELHISWPKDESTTTDPGPRDYDSAAPTLPLGSLIDAAGWSTVAGTDVLANITDTDPATGMRSATNPTSQTFRVYLPRMVAPVGDFKVNIEGYRDGGGSSSSVVGSIYEGVTLRATSNTLTSFGASNTPGVLTFLAANLTGITGSAWPGGTLELRLTVTAS